MSLIRFDERTAFRRIKDLEEQLQESRDAHVNSVKAMKKRIKKLNKVIKELREWW